jgi:hypothetical protein
MTPELRKMERLVEQLLEQRKAEVTALEAVIKIARRRLDTLQAIKNLTSDSEVVSKLRNDDAKGYLLTLLKEAGLLRSIEEGLTL